MRDRSKRLTVINTSSSGTNGESGNTGSQGGGYGVLGYGGTVDLSNYLLKSVWDTVWEIKKDSNGTQYIYSKLPLVTRYGVTMYSGDDPLLPSVYEGIPIDGISIYWHTDENGNRVLKALGGGGGEGGVSEVTYDMVINALGYIPYNSNNPNQFLTKNDFSAGVYDYNNPSEPIRIGFAGNSLTANTASFLAAYGNDNGRRVIKDITLKEVRIWLGLGALAYQDSVEVSGLGSLAYKNSLTQNDIPNLSWNKITSDKPTTLSGYGITDAYTKSEIDNRVTDSYTKNEIDNKLSNYILTINLLSKIKEIDGTGSGIDADTIDGVHNGSLTASSCTGNSATATKLQYKRKIWGQEFDGSANVTGDLTSTGNISSLLNNYYTIGTTGNQYKSVYTGWVGAIAGRNLSLGSGGNTYMTITSSGKIGVGVALPEEAFEVDGNILTTESVIIDDIPIKKSEDDVLFIDGNLVVRGGVTMYGTSYRGTQLLLDVQRVDEMISESDKQTYTAKSITLVVSDVLDLKGKNEYIYQALDDLRAEIEEIRAELENK